MVLPDIVGGQKKKPLGKSGADDSKEKGKKTEESKPRQAEITVTLDSGQAMSIIKSSKVITCQELARQAGVKISAANAFLKSRLESGEVTRAGGHGSCYLYQSAE